MEGHLRKPNYQRDFVWEYPKRLNWVRSVFSKDGIKGYGAICTYELKQDLMYSSDIFLCDGFQRLSTIKELIEEPKKYLVTLLRQLAREFLAFR
jgi:hypothetical protein